MRHLKGRASIGALLAAAAWFAGSAATADIIPVFDVATATAGGSELSYSVSISSGSKVDTGDYFTIYDFNGYIPGSAFAPVDWSIAEQNVGITPAGQVLIDSANIMNLTFTYRGAASIVGPSYPVGGVGAFGAESELNALTAFGQYASASHKNNPGKPDHNTKQANQGFVVTPTAVPEASTLMMLLSGLVPLAFMLPRRPRRGNPVGLGVRV